MSVSLLVQFLELYHLEEDVLKNMFGVLLILWKFTGHSKNITTLSDIEFQVFISTFVGDLSKTRLFRGECFI